MISKTHDLLKPFHTAFSKPQFNHFSGFINCLSVCEIPSLNRFSKIHNKSRSSLNRFLTKSPWKIDSVRQIYHSQLASYIAKDSYLIIDDTISHRPYAFKVEKANWHYDHTLNKDSLGYSLVTSTVLSEGNVIPYDLLPYYRKKDCNDIPFFTKNDLAERVILSTKNNPHINTVLFDSWYANNQVIRACKEAEKDYITSIKSNRNVTINNRRNAVRSFVKHIKGKDWTICMKNGQLFRFFATSAFISGIRSVHLIFSQMYNEKSEKWGDTVFLISNMLNTESRQILFDYLKRVGIESFHREAKQNTGLEGYFLRNNRGIEKYLFLVMLTYAILVLQSLSAEKFLTIGEQCEESKIGVYEAAFEQISRNPELKSVIFRRLAKARV